MDAWRDNRGGNWGQSSSAFFWRIDWADFLSLSEQSFMYWSSHGVDSKLTQFPQRTMLCPLGDLQSRAQNNNLILSLRPDVPYYHRAADSADWGPVMSSGCRLIYWTGLWWIHLIVTWSGSNSGRSELCTNELTRSMQQMSFWWRNSF